MIIGIIIIVLLFLVWWWNIKKKLNKIKESIPETPIPYPNTVRLWEVDWDYGNDMVIKKVNVYGHIYINNNDKIKIIIKTFNDEDMNYNIRCAEELIEKILE